MEPISEKKEQILVSITGQDRPGLTASIMTILAQHQAEILDIGQADIHSTLSLGILIRIDENHSGQVLKELLFKATELGVNIGFSPITDDEYEEWVGRQGKNRHILTLSRSLYHSFGLRRVFFSAYMPCVEDARLPERETPVPLRREHRLYQADWLMRFYNFEPTELVSPDAPWLDLDVDPKLAWALAHMERFPVEVNTASESELLRVPGIGPTSARRIVAARKQGSLGFDDLRRMRVTLKRAIHFLSCRGQREAAFPADPELIRARVLADARTSSYNRAQRLAEQQLSLF